jgi:hypothetical protein
VDVNHVCESSFQDLSLSLSLSRILSLFFIHNEEWCLKETSSAIDVLQRLT